MNEPTIQIRAKINETDLHGNPLLFGVTEVRIGILQAAVTINKKRYFAHFQLIRDLNVGPIAMDEVVAGAVACEVVPLREVPPGEPIHCIRIGDTLEEAEDHDGEHIS